MVSFSHIFKSNFIPLYGEYTEYDEIFGYLFPIVLCPSTPIIKLSSIKNFSLILL